MAKLIEKTVVMDGKAIERALPRIAHEIIEKNKGTKDVIIVGIRKRGVPLAERLSSIIGNIEGVHIPIGVLDITLYRDDLAHMSYQPLIQETHIDEDITNKTLVLVDDVLYTGRTIRAALDALIDLGRPKKIQLAVLIDRGHRELPIRADYVGKNVPTATKEAIAVKLTDTDDCDKVFIGEYI